MFMGTGILCAYKPRVNKPTRYGWGLQDPTATHNLQEKKLLFFGQRAKIQKNKHCGSLKSQENGNTPPELQIKKISQS